MGATLGDIQEICKNSEFSWLYGPIDLPMISLMSGEQGTGGHEGSSEGKDSLQMRLFEEKGDDRA